MRWIPWCQITSLCLLLPGAPWAQGMEEIETDLLIVGGTESGWAAAIQAARLGVSSITMVHDGAWLGGQYTEQALACVDENKGVGRIGWGPDWHPMKRSFHRFGLFKELMDEIEASNTETYGSPMPGKPHHGPSTFRPAEAERIFRRMLRPYLDSGQVRWIPHHYPVRAEVVENRLSGVWFAAREEEEARLKVKARLTIDASDWGEVIQVAGAAYECGPDPKTRYGEASAPDDLSANPPNEMNPITWAMIVAESDEETPIPRPGRFDDRNYPRATRVSNLAFRDLPWEKQLRLGSILHWPPEGQEAARQLSVYSVRRIVEGTTSKDGKTSILLNYMNGQDYALERLPQPVVDALEATEPGASRKNIVEMSRAQRQIVFDDAKQHALGVLYHMQNFVHERVEDRANSLRRFHLSREFGTSDHLPPKPYIRESLRLKALYMMREQDGRNRDGETKTAARERFAEVMYPDGVFSWQFHYDFHRTGRIYLKTEGASGPWIDYHKPNRHTKFISDRSVFPLRSLIPEEMDGLLGAQGNVGFSSIVSAAIRLHDQRIHIGQAVGAAASVALKNEVSPRRLAEDRELLETVRAALCGSSGGVPMLLWPYRDLPTEHPAFVAINRLAALRLLPAGSREIDFRPDDLATSKWRENVERKATEVLGHGGTLPEADGLSRGEFCQAWWEQLSGVGLRLRPWERKREDDADADGIPDRDDPYPFTASEPVRFEIRGLELTEETDGVPPLLKRESQGGARFQFHGKGLAEVSGYQSDHGMPFREAQGYGWRGNLSGNHRVRGKHKNPLADTFLFTRQQDTWECEVEPGRYRVLVCVGDSAHEQNAQQVVVEGSTAVDQVSTLAGEFEEAEVEVEVKDGLLTVEIGSGNSGSNTCLNWLIWERIP